MHGLMLGYAPKATKVVHPVFLLITGPAEARIRREAEDKVWMVQPAIGLEVNGTRWFRIAAELGYRFISNTDFQQLSDTDFSAPYAGIRFKFGWSWGK